MSTPAKPVVAQKSSISSMVIVPLVKDVLKENAFKLVFKPCDFWGIAGDVDGADFVAEQADNNTGTPIIDARNLLR